MKQRDLVLLLVAFHPSVKEVNLLLGALAGLPQRIGYAVVVNDHCPGEAAEQLADRADAFLCNSDNPGYGRGINQLVSQLVDLPEYIGVLNTDLSWQPGTFETMLAWLVFGASSDSPAAAAPAHPDVKGK